MGMEEEYIQALVTPTSRLKVFIQVTCLDCDGLFIKKYSPLVFHVNKISFWYILIETSTHSEETVFWVRYLPTELQAFGSRAVKYPYKRMLVIFPLGFLIQARVTSH